MYSALSPFNTLDPDKPPVDHRDIRALRAELLELRVRIERIESLMLAYAGEVLDEKNELG